MGDLNYSRQQARRCSKLIFVLTEGSSREPEYFGNFSAENSRFRIHVIERNDQENNSPDGLLRKAKKYRQNVSKLLDIQIRRDDEFWLVVDVDKWPHLPELIQKTRNSGWNIAISNPCFEVWLYFHFFDSRIESENTDWKRLVDNSVGSGAGFQSSKHHKFYKNAVRNSKAVYSENGSIPGYGTTSVYQIFQNFVEEIDS